ncbi:hypothetical protein ACRQ1B_24565 [Rhizobium panacihumi]|uniref:hypothetical protein n=1 Tax=Rhizobium panacihumi TaxID=2008450 RepID=UPI003D7C06AE
MGKVSKIGGIYGALQLQKRLEKAALSVAIIGETGIFGAALRSIRFRLGVRHEARQTGGEQLARKKDDRQTIAPPADDAETYALTREVSIGSEC